MVNQYLKDQIAPQALPNMHLTLLGLIVALKDWWWLSYRPIFTPQIRQFLLYNFRRHVGNVLIAVEEPNLPQSILLHPHYKSPITHQRTLSFRCYRRTSLRGRKFVTTKLIVNGWCYERRICCFWRCKPTPMMMKEGGTRSKWSCHRWKDVQSIADGSDNQPPIKKIKTMISQ